MKNETLTALEWLVDEIEKHYIINNGTLDPIKFMELKRQAIAMEIQQIKDLYSTQKEYKIEESLYFGGGNR